MARIYNSAEELIGSTPLLRLNNIEKEFALSCRMLAKIEAFNPAGSAKDRVAVSMLDAAEKDGLINKNSVIIEPTSGNTGIGLAAVGARRGYKVIVVMPNNMSEERIKLMRAYGAEVVLTDGSEGMIGSIKYAEELAAKTPNSFIPGQFTNPAGPLAHYLGTGAEIWEDTDGQVDVFVASVGCGSTLSGAGAYLKEKSARVSVVAVEPERSPVLSGGAAGPHGIAGIGAGFVPSILRTDIIDEVVAISDEDAAEMSRALVRLEGLLCGISSGAALAAAIRVGARAENAGKTVVLILPDSGERYLSGNLFFD